MPRQWQVRAALGTTLLAVIAPPLTLTATSLGYHPPKLLLQLLLALEILAALFAVALLSLPLRVWTLGRRQSDVMHALSMSSIGVLTAPVPNSLGKRCQFDIRLQNHKDVAIKCYIETLDITIAAIGLATSSLSSRTLELLIPANDVKPLRSPTIDGVPAGNAVSAVIKWIAVYGPASGKFDVRWRRNLTFQFTPNVPDSATWTENQPDSHEPIKPIRMPLNTTLQSTEQ